LIADSGTQPKARSNVLRLTHDFVIPSAARNLLFACAEEKAGSSSLRSSE
jgi:hypothetical protein